MMCSRGRCAIGTGLALFAAVAVTPPVLAAGGRFFELLETAVNRAEEAKQARISGRNQSGQSQIADIWNPQGCGFTDRSTLSLARTTRLDRIELWYNWRARETATAYDIVDSSGLTVAQGTLLRASCDPYQASWCVAGDSPGIELLAGDYSIRTPSTRICQNGASGGRGFIRAWGSAANLPERPVSSAPQSLGTRWQVHEEMPDGRYWTALWTRRKGTAVFDAVWKDSLSGQSFTGTVELRRNAGGTVVLWREATGGTYTGRISSDGRTIRGTASWYPPGAFWSARIER